jgi:hypothetical protein
MALASLTLLPRMRAMTSPALRGETRTYFAVALTMPLLPPHTALFVAAVASESTGESELSQTVTDHTLADVDRHMFAPVVNRDRVTDHLGINDRSSRPGFQHSLFTRLVHCLDTLHEPLFDEGSFFA